MKPFGKQLAQFALICAVSLSTGTASAQSEAEEHVLDGATIDWSYDANGARMLLTFENGLARYEWIEGRRAGNKAQDIPYRSREMSDGLFVVSWDQADRPDFITLIFDFNKSVMASTGLIGYGTDNQRNLFQNGTVHSLDQ
ncbi:hypothetical protein [uncultured Tateyamaria sp.]|uniref:hypothetical protein n=1 Tax=uncultured Tateyamaria sp. TaxID=455651 RepID=UPI0026301034|nr:hypothetical protein [uncultured Tateyamaria sp.]